jgi:hypothetical protein
MSFVHAWRLPHLLSAINNPPAGRWTYGAMNGLAALNVSLQPCGNDWVDGWTSKGAPYGHHTGTSRGARHPYGKFRCRGRFIGTPPSARR